MPCNFCRTFRASLVLLLAGLPTRGVTAEPSHQRERLGELPPSLIEASGLAASAREPGLLWAHNDRGSQPLLHAFESNGQLRGRVRLTGVRGYDWEDMASFVMDGEAWLMVADVGDNHLHRKNAVLEFVREPDPAQLAPDRVLSLPVGTRLAVRFPEGPEDIEAAAVDAVRREIILVGKRRFPPRVYRLPLLLDPTAAEDGPSAEVIGEVSTIDPPSWLQLLTPTPSGILRPLPTGLDISPDGRLAVLLTYGDVLLYSREPDSDWSTVFSRPPLHLEPHGLPQAEAVAFDRQRRALYVTSEGRQQPLLRYDLPTLDATAPGTDASQP